MAHLQLSFTRPIPEQWQNLSEDEWNAKLGAILSVVDKHGGSVKVIGYSPGHMATLAVIEYPDQSSGVRAVAGVASLGTIEFQSIHPLWDLGEWRTLMAEGAAST
jgi:uncharacterized protein with GYD domain